MHFWFAQRLKQIAGPDGSNGPLEDVASRQNGTKSRGDVLVSRDEKGWIKVIGDS